MIGPQKVNIGFSLHTRHGPYSGPPWIRLWTTFMNGPLPNSTYGCPQTSKNLWVPPPKFCLIHRNATSHKFVMGPFVAYDSPQNLTYGCPPWISKLIFSAFLQLLSRFSVLFSILEITVGFQYGPGRYVVDHHGPTWRSLEEISPRYWKVLKTFFATFK